MWLHLVGAAFVLIPGLLALQAWRFLRLGAPTLGQRLRGLPRCTAAELNGLRPGERAVVEGRVRPAEAGAPLPSVTVKKRVSRRGARTRETWRDKASTPALRLVTEDGTVLLANADYALHFPRDEDAAGEPRALREGDVACAVVSFEEKGRVPRARAEWLYAGGVARCVADAPLDTKTLRWAVIALTATAALSAAVWGWLALGLSRPRW